MTLLGFIVDPKVSPVLRGVVEDPDRRIWFSALLGLARNEDIPSRQRLIEMYSADGTADSEQDQIVDALLLHPENGGTKVLAAALLNNNTFAPTRVRIAEALGRVGDDTVLEALRKTKGASSNPAVVEMAASAIVAIEERGGAATLEE